MASQNGSYARDCGNLYLFLELPDRAARDVFVAEAISAMEKARQTLDPAHLIEPDGTPTFPEYMLSEAHLRFDRLVAHLAATRDLAARMKAARDGGDAPAEDRLFRAIVIAKWLGAALIDALRMLALARMEIGGAFLEGGKRLKLVAQTGHSRGIRQISFDANGSRLITAAGDGRAISWEAATGDELHTFWLDSPQVSDPAGVALSPDGTRMVVVGDKGMAIRYPLQDMYPLEDKVVPYFWDPMRFAAFSSNGANLVTLGAEAIVWTVLADDIEEARRFGKRDDAKARVAAFSPRTNIVLTEGPNHEAILWDAGTGAELRTLAGHAAPLRAAAFSADGARAATLDTAGVVIVWDALTAGRLLDLATTDEPTSIALSPDGRLLVTVSAGAGVQMVELDAQPPGPRARPDPGNDRRGGSVAFGGVAAAGRGHG
jgi:hypothetical protein